MFLIDEQRQSQFVRHFVLPGKNAVLQPPHENFQIRQTMCALCQVLQHDSEPSHCESSYACYYSHIEGLGFHVVYITRYVIVSVK